MPSATPSAAKREHPEHASGSRRNSRAGPWSARRSGSGAAQASRRCRPVVHEDVFQRRAVCRFHQLRPCPEQVEQRRDGQVDLGHDQPARRVLHAHVADAGQRHVPDRAAARRRPSRTRRRARRAGGSARAACRARSPCPCRRRRRDRTAPRLVHVVGGQQDGAAAGLVPFEERPQLAPRLRVEAGGQLVEEEHVERADQRTGNRQPLLLPARQRRSARRAWSRPTSARISSTARPLA